MKFFRWILRHLTLIVVVSLLVYLYWHRNEIRSAENDTVSVTVNDANPVASTQAAATTASGSLNTGLQGSAGKKSNEKHAIIENEEQQILLYPDDIENRDTAEKLENPGHQPIRAVLTSQQKPDDHEAPEGFVQRKRMYEQTLSLIESERKVAASDTDVSASVSPEDEDNFAEFSQPPAESQEQAVALESVGFQDQQLQEQIRSRQQQLSNRMVSLISVTMEQPEVATAEQPVVDIEPVQPVIHTTEQQELVLQARQAFERGKFELAEEKYLQLMDQLPELPDVAGELANVYKIQNRQADYIAMSTNFVKRLVDHYRFNEAWRVMTEVAKINKDIANKQRRIINKKHQELQL